MSVLGYGALFMVAAIGGGTVGSLLNFLVVPAVSAAFVGGVSLGVATPLSLLLSTNKRLRQPRAISPAVVGAGIAVLGVLWLIDSDPAFDTLDPRVVVGMVIVGLVFAVYWAVLKLTASLGNGDNTGHAV